MHFIFDLDHTVVDSSHRQLTDINGSLDLAHWRENCTREKIMRDSLLPLAETMQGYIKSGVSVVICTARVLGEHDIEFLRTNGLHTPHILSRAEGDCSRDDALKTRLLGDFAKSLGLEWRDFAESSVMFDDNASVLRAMDRLGIDAIDAIELNNELRGMK